MVQATLDQGIALRNAGLDSVGLHHASWIEIAREIALRICRRDGDVGKGRDMRFDLSESIEAMRQGQKTQTRRRSDYWFKRLGKRITIVHLGQLLGWATVRRVWRQELATMTHEEARAEGYETITDFRTALRQLYGPEADDYTHLVAIEFGDIEWLEVPA